MFKLKLYIENKNLECPAEGCSHNPRKKMTRHIQRSIDSLLSHGEVTKAKSEFSDCYCFKHNIFISPTTFIYEDFSHNLLWYTGDDKNLFDNVYKVKRIKHQFFHDNSEDAITWNIFRFLEKNELTAKFLSSIIGHEIKFPETIYWSYSQKQQGPWCALVLARREFGEVRSISESMKRGSEPDLIIKTEKDLFFIEAKFGTNNNSPSNKREVAEKIKNHKKYDTGGDNWFYKVFNSQYSYADIIKERKYELMRFWLIGTWIANQLKIKRFYLINLVKTKEEPSIENDFGKFLILDKNRQFIRVTWEDIYHFITQCVNISKQSAILQYYENKTSGYKKTRNRYELQQAFECARMGGK